MVHYSEIRKIANLEPELENIPLQIVVGIDFFNVKFSGDGSIGTEVCFMRTKPDGSYDYSIKFDSSYHIITKKMGHEKTVKHLKAIEKFAENVTSYFKEVGELLAITNEEKSKNEK